MDQLNIGGWLLLSIASISLIVFFGNYFKKIFKLGWFLLIQIAIGSIFIFIFNILGEIINIYIPLNIFTSFTVGVLGIPGLITLIAARVLLI